MHSALVTETLHYILLRWPKTALPPTNMRGLEVQLPGNIGFILYNVKIGSRDTMLLHFVLWHGVTWPKADHALWWSPPWAKLQLHTVVHIISASSCHVAKFPGIFILFLDLLNMQLYLAQVATPSNTDWNKGMEILLWMGIWHQHLENRYASPDLKNLSCTWSGSCCPTYCL